MDWTSNKLVDIAEIQTGKLDSNQAEENGIYPFFTCAPTTLRINRHAFNCNAILLAGNNANGIFHIKRYKGRFNAYQRTYVITSKKTDNYDIDFLFYVLMTLTKRLGDFSQGTATKFLTVKILNNLDIPSPPLPEQKAIAHILGTLDDKIELNREMNKTLEAMAGAIFKSWFIDFDPVIDNALRAGNPIPERFAERAERRREMLDQNQPSWLEGQPPSSPGPFSQGAKGGIDFEENHFSQSVKGSEEIEGCMRGVKGSHYRGGYDFSGLVERARELRKLQTPAEALFWEIVRDRQFLGLKFRRQHQIGDYIVDFYCHEVQLVIELDGGVHTQTQQKDHKRDSWLQSKGFTVLRFTNTQILEDLDNVLQEISSSISSRGIGSSPTPAGDMGNSDYNTSSISSHGIGSSPAGRGGGEGSQNEGSQNEGLQNEGSMDNINRLFPDEFVDSEMGAIPKGWEVKNLPEVINVNPSIKLEKGVAAPYLEMKNMPTFSARVVGWVLREFSSGMRFNNGDTLMARITPCLENGKTAYVDFLDEDQVGWGSTEYIVFRSNTKLLPREYVYFLVTSDEFRSHAIINMTGTSGRQRVPVNAFDSYNLVLPVEEIAKRFGDLCSSFFLKMKSNDEESTTLSSIRDLLLPKLISGEIRIKDAEKFIGEQT